MKIIILAAGKGTRLGNNIPKILTTLPGNKTIMDRLLNSITPFVKQIDISLVVGYKKNLIIKKNPSLNYILNNNYEITNTAKSLALALDNIENETIIWINGDLVMDENIFKHVYTYDGNCMAVSNKTILDEEEIKYTTNSKGSIEMVSKTVKNGLGEAFGINKISKNDLNLFKESLNKCADNDYFEKGLEIAISDGLIINPLNINNLFYTEIDFKKDLEYAVQFLKKKEKFYE